jgi:hypothetical protein
MARDCGRTARAHCQIGSRRILGDDFDLTDDGFVKRSNVFREYPVLQVIFSPCLPDLIAIQDRLRDEKARDVSLAAGSHVPVTCNLHRVVFAQDWIKDWLLRQSGMDLVSTASAGAGSKAACLCNGRGLRISDLTFWPPRSRGCCPGRRRRSRGGRPRADTRSIMPGPQAG